MRQLLLRVDYVLHAPLTSRARSSGTSFNSPANDILGASMEVGTLDRRQRLTLQLMGVGVLGSRGSSASSVVTDDRASVIREAIDSMRGVGPLPLGTLDREGDR